MELQHIAIAISVANFILTWGVALYMYLANKNKVTNDRINTLEQDLDTKLDGHSDRIARLEAKTGGAPTHTDLAGIHEKINEVAGSVKELKGEFNATNRTLQLIHETLMERK